MTEKYTRITLPNSKSLGLLDLGEKSPAEMIRQIRILAKTSLEEANDILKARDNDFQIDVVKGSIVQHHIKTLQNSKRIK